MTEAVVKYDKDFNFTRKTDTPESKAFWNFVDDTSWEVRHLWPTWKVAEGYFKTPRKKIETKKDLEEFLEKEGHVVQDTNFLELTLHGYRLLFVIDGDVVRTYSSTCLYK